MSDYSVLKASFQYGEISPFFGGQVQSEIYAAGVREMKNVLPDQAGGFRKRNGTIYFASPDPTVKTRLMEFYTGSESFLLAMNENGTYLYRASDPFNQLCSTTTPYSTYAEIMEMKFRANKGILYLVHPSYKPQTLTITYTPGPPEVWSMAFADITFVPSGKFGSTGNYPSAICFKGGRLFLAATDTQPTTVWASRTPDDTDRYNDFTLNDNDYQPTEDTSVVSNKKYYEKTYNAQGEAVFTLKANPTGDPKAQSWYEWYNYKVLSSHAFELEENDMYGTKIHWLAVQNRVICGNKRAIFMDTGDISSPTLFDMTVSLNTGSSPIQAKAYKNYVLFLGVNEKQLYLMVWDENLQNYTAMEITRSATHLFKNGIADFDIMLDPELIIWVVTKDGKLYSCSNATGWAEHPRTAGKYTTLAVAGESHSRMFLEVWENPEEEDDTNWKYHFEYLDVLSSDTTEGVFTDCSTVFDFGLDLDEEPICYKDIPVNKALEGLEVSAFAWDDPEKKGAIMPKVTAEDDSGTIYAKYKKAVNKGSVGLPIECEVRLFPPELPANGTSIGKTKRISRVTTRLYSSFGGKIAVDDAEPIQMLTRRYGVYRYGDGVELVSDDVSVDTMGRNTKQGSVRILHDEPVPFNVLSVGTRFELMEV